MSLSKITSKDLKEKCLLLGIKDYGKKEVMIARISKHFIDSGLGFFDLESFIEELKHANEPLTSSHSLREESSNSETSSSNSQPSTVSTVLILEEEGEEEEEEEEDRESISKKPKVAVKPVYIVQQICENETQAIAIIKEADCWKSYCCTTRT